MLRACFERQNNPRTPAVCEPDRTDLELEWARTRVPLLVYQVRPAAVVGDRRRDMSWSAKKLTLDPGRASLALHSVATRNPGYAFTLAEQRRRARAARRRRTWGRLAAWGEVVGGAVVLVAALAGAALLVYAAGWE
jgi:hypothetical protein